MFYATLMFTLLCIFTYLFKKINSKEPNKIQFHFNYFVIYFVTSVVSIVFLPYFLLSPRNVRNAKIGTRAVKEIVSKIIHVKFCLRNGEVLAEDRGAVIVSNHQNSLDVLGMFNIWDVIDKLTAIAKKELFYVWPFGLSAYLAGVVFIDRNDRKGAYKQLEITSKVMVENKTKLWLFPEGTRNKDYTKLLPFKKGAFAIAVAAQVPVIPVVYSPYYFINAKENIFNKGHVVIQCLEPIPTKGLTNDDVPALIERVHEKMTTAYKELSKEVLSELPDSYPYTNRG